MNDQLKEQIINELEKDRRLRGMSQSRYATRIGIHKSTYSFMVKRHWDSVSTSKWIAAARAIDFQLDRAQQWRTAETVVFKSITTQLATVKQQGMCAVVCDIAGIGKTHACKEFAKVTSETFYINCSSCPNKSRFIRSLAAALGLEVGGTLEDAFQDCIFYINTALEKPLLILDEAGDLQQSALLMLKRLYNGTEFHLGIYAVGARGLEHSLRKGIRLKKNGYEEVWSRLTGDAEHAIRFTPRTGPGTKTFLEKEAETICAANGVMDEGMVAGIVSHGGDMRRVRREIMKLRELDKLAA